MPTIPSINIENINARGNDHGITKNNFTKNPGKNYGPNLASNRYMQSTLTGNMNLPMASAHVRNATHATNKLPNAYKGEQSHYKKMLAMNQLELPNTRNNAPRSLDKFAMEARGGYGIDSVSNLELFQ